MFLPCIFMGESSLGLTYSFINGLSLIFRLSLLVGFSMFMLVQKGLSSYYHILSLYILPYGCYSIFSIFYNRFSCVWINGLSLIILVLSSRFTSSIFWLFIAFVGMFITSEGLMVGVSTDSLLSYFLQPGDTLIWDSTLSFTFLICSTIHSSCSILFSSSLSDVTDSSFGSWFCSSFMVSCNCRSSCI